MSKKSFGAANSTGKHMNRLVKQTRLEYDSEPGLNASKIIPGLKSMRHMKWFMDRRSPDSPQMRFGRLVHAAVLEPEAFESYPVWSGRRSGKCWDAFLAENDTTEIITEAEKARISHAKGSIYSDHRAREYLDGLKEISALWGCEHGSYKARLDVLSEGNYICDLKLTSDPSPTWFKRQATRMNYHVRMGFYQDGVKAITGHRLPVYIIAVEDKPPHDVVVYEYDDAALEIGRLKVERVLNDYYKALESGYWPGYCEGVYTLRVTMDEANSVLEIADSLMELEMSKDI